jgi:bifunctional pyridoxal-dependent enzyme with beta-cystathionase and maltose regulon repressor activities
MQIMELPMCMKDMKFKLKKEMKSKLKKEIPRQDFGTM